jgi:hypothetical protein
MPAVYSALIISSSAVIVTALKLVLLWQRYGYCTNPDIRSIFRFNAGICMIAVVANIAILVYSFSDPAPLVLQLLLSLAGIPWLLFKVRSPLLEEVILITIAKTTIVFRLGLQRLLPRYCQLLGGLLGGVSILFLIMALVSSGIIASRKYIASEWALGIVLLGSFAADNFMLCVLYLLILASGVVKKFNRKNLFLDIGLSSTYTLAVSFSLGLFVRNLIDLVTALLVSSMIAITESANRLSRYTTQRFICGHC